MSATLVETFTFPQPHQLHPLPLTFTPHTTSQDEKSAAQLAHLASQHHTSEYNRIKFGPQGCPIRYVPLSIHMPDHFRELKRRQEFSLQQRSWWPCDKPSSSTLQPVVVLGPCGAPSPSMINLQQEILAAMASPLESNPRPPLQAQTYPDPQVKTSSTHPINISTMIPQELIPLISSHLLLSAQQPPSSSPTIFEISSSFTLDRLISTQPQYPYRYPNQNNLQFFPIPSLPYPPPNYKSNATQPPHLRTRSSVSEALQAAINSGLAAVGKVSSTSNTPTRVPTPVHSTVDPKLPLRSPPPCHEDTFMPNKALNENTLTLHHPNASSVSLSLSLSLSVTPRYPPLDQHSLSAPPTISEFDIPGVTLSQAVVERDGEVNNRLRDILWHANSDGEEQKINVDGGVDVPTRAPRSSNGPPPPPTQPRENRIWDSTSTPTPIPIQSQPAPHPSPPPFTLGNIFLSSCPGKKVRLQGPVKGRSGVCRDLSTDLARMCDLGVGCVVCCLDDKELDFLGAPWPEYERAARGVGVDVLRIPTPEGLAPLTPSLLDMHLTDLINTYTLRGIPVLVHCRGGVGRAGVVACCWVIKLGLCGWLEGDSSLTTDRLDGMGTGLRGIASMGAGGTGVGCGSGLGSMGALVRRDTTQLVEKVIGVVRKRRSVKAVETYEQVRFLVDFVEYLRCGRRGEVTVCKERDFGERM